MIFSDECYLRDLCWKNLHTDSECSHSNIYCPKLFRINYLYDEALLTKRQRTHTSLRLDEDRTDKEAFLKLRDIEQNIEKFVEDGENLYLHSKTCGNGKTEWALRMLQSYVSKIWHKSDLRCRVLFISVSRYLLALKDNISNINEYATHINKNVLDADIVVFDDLATKGATTFELENLFSIIECRINNNKSNIYTSNASGDELREKVGDRLYSRIVNMSVNIELFGADKRGITK
jgi:DNA replication protein DnaC